MHANSTTQRRSAKSWHCAAKKPNCWATPILGKCPWCPRWPNLRRRGSPSCVIWPDAHAPTPRRISPTCARLPPNTWAWPIRRPGTGPTFPKNSRKRATPSASRSSRSTSRRPRCWRARSRSSKPCSKCPSGATRPPSGTPPLSSNALSARTRRRGGAWMDDVRTRWLRPDTGVLQTPVAHLVCNFASGVDGKPPLLTHDDVITLFHEFGHGLHHMLTQVNERDVSGIGGVEWDAVELPSQFMENFCWEWDVLKHMTAHVDTGEPLPRALFDKMIAAKNYQSGMQTLRQIEFSLFDMLLHTEHDPAQDIMPLLDQVRREVAVLQPPAFSRTAHTFSNIFAGGYAAGYYSYKWAEVLSADAYAAFEETAGSDGLPSIETGRRYRQAILEAGGSRPAMESFKAFRGSEPSLDALLRHQGMAEESTTA